MSLDDNMLNRMDQDLEALSQLFLRFPSIKQLLDEEKYYESDKFIRTEAARLLQEEKPNIQNLTRRLSSDIRSGNAIEAVSRLETKIDTMINRIEHAEFADKRAFSKLKVRLEDLHRLLKYDTEFLNTASEISDTIKLLEDKMREEIIQSCEDITDQLNNLDHVINERKKILMGV